MRGVLNFFGIKTKQQKQEEFEALEPIGVSNVPGIEIFIEKKSGVKLKTQQEGQSEEQSASTDSYYQVTVKGTGENADYPELKADFLYATLLPGDSGQGMINSLSYIPGGAKYINFEVVEKFNDMKTPCMGVIRGIELPPHHHLEIRAVFQRSVDQDPEKHMGGIGFAVRKSEKESPAYQRAIKSPSIGMMI